MNNASINQSAVSATVSVSDSSQSSLRVKKSLVKELYSLSNRAT
jgi:hypothetical protein